MVLRTMYMPLAIIGAVQLLRSEGIPLPDLGVGMCGRCDHIERSVGAVLRNQHPVDREQTSKIEARLLPDGLAVSRIQTHQVTGFAHTVEEAIQQDGRTKLGDDVLALPLELRRSGRWFQHAAAMLVSAGDKNSVRPNLKRSCAVDVVYAFSRGCSKAARRCPRPRR